jgi:hypothetical protein
MLSSCCIRPPASTTLVAGSTPTCILPMTCFVSGGVPPASAFCRPSGMAANSVAPAAAVIAVMGSR